MNTLLTYFKGSFLVTFIGLAAAFWLGGIEAIVLALILSVLEVSLSFDNAVVNATVLRRMTPKWQQRFLTWGILIAVFGMRIVFPVAIVSIIAGLSPWDAMNVAVNDPEQYAAYLTESHVSLMGFGGAFLLMVGLDFFLDEDKEHWIDSIEQYVVKLGVIPGAAYILAGITIVAMAFSGIESPEDRQSFVVAGGIGLLTYFVIHTLAGYMEKVEEARSSANNAVASGGLALFLYLEVLDASFSFDGVIGAFAVTTNIFIIAIGLGIGAMFVRSLTIMLVKKGTLSEFVYLEHGAFYAIIALASIMMLKSFIHIPEVVTGFIGAGFIGLAFAHSLVVRKRDQHIADLEAQVSEQN